MTLAIRPEKLWVTVYAEDDEAADIWIREVGIDPTWLTRIATMDNFWQMGGYRTVWSLFRDFL